MLTGSIALIGGSSGALLTRTDPRVGRVSRFALLEYAADTLERSGAAGHRPFVEDHSVDAESVPHLTESRGGERFSERHQRLAAARVSHAIIALTAPAADVEALRAR